MKLSEVIAKLTEIASLVPDDDPPVRVIYPCGVGAAQVIVIGEVLGISAESGRGREDGQTTVIIDAEGSPLPTNRA